MHMMKVRKYCLLKISSKLLEYYERAYGNAQTSITSTTIVKRSQQRRMPFQSGKAARQERGKGKQNTTAQRNKTLLYLKGPLTYACNKNFRKMLFSKL